MDNIKLGTYHMTDNPEHYEVARGNDFEFIVTGVDNILRAGADKDDDNAYITNAQDVLYYSVVSAFIPNFTQEKVSISRGNSTMNFAGKPTFQDGSVVINDYIGAGSKSALMAWQRLSYDVKTDSLGLAKDYKKTCYLLERDPAGNLVRTWKLLGCWISGINESDYSSDDQSKRTITATVVFDRAIPEDN